MRGAQAKPQAGGGNPQLRIWPAWRCSPNLTAAPGAVLGFLKGFTIRDGFILDFPWIFLPFLCKTLFGQGTATSSLSTDRDYSSRCSSACTGRGNGPKTSTRPLQIPSVPGSRDRAGIWHSQPHHSWLQDRARGHVAVPVPGQASQCGRGRVQPAVVQLSLAEPPQEALVG